jgi:hypothetical protein
MRRTKAAPDRFPGEFIVIDAGRWRRRPKVPAPGLTGGPTADGSTRVLGVVTAIDASSMTVRTDAGDEVTATLSDATHYPAEPPVPGADRWSAATSKPVVGQRVELRVLDGAVVDAGVVHVHADGAANSDGSAIVVSSLRIVG